MERHSAPLPRTTGAGWRFAEPPDGDGLRSRLEAVERRELPELVPYVWRGQPRPLHARVALRRAADEHGVPES